MATSLLQELEDSIHRGTPESRSKALWHATDLLIAGRYDEEQIWFFGEIIQRLAEEIEHASRVRLASLLAHSDKAPFAVVRQLAFDQSIEVAGQVLQHSPRLNTDMLVANARAMGQKHLLAISRRHSIPTEVTDELVRRGNREVVRSVASNKGARFSEFGFLHMVKRSEDDQILAEHLCERKEIPRHIFQQLIAKASDEVKHKLRQERPELEELISDSVGDVVRGLQSCFGPASKSYFAAKKAVSAQYHRGQLNEAAVLGYARAHKPEETTVALSILCSLPVDAVERALFDKSRELILIIARALSFDWETTMALLFLGAKDHRISAQDLETNRTEYTTLNSATCRSIIATYQNRKAAAQSEMDRNRVRRA